MIDLIVWGGVIWLSAAALIVVCLFVLPVTFGPLYDARKARRHDARTARTMAVFEECGLAVVRAPYPTQRITHLPPEPPPVLAVVPPQRRPINGATR